MYLNSRKADVELLNDRWVQRVEIEHKDESVPGGKYKMVSSEDAKKRRGLAGQMLPNYTK